ncbi:unnamed protein product [Urochloa humidicola]
MAAIRSSSSLALTLLPLLLAAVLTPSLASPAATDGLDGEALLMLGRFHGWMAAHGRSYASEEEKLHRFQVYRSNMEFIKAANRDIRMNYELGETPFTDLTHDEFMAMYISNIAVSLKSEAMMMITTRAGPVHEGSGRRSGLPLATADEPPRHGNLTALPASVDWRAKGVVTPAKNQGTKCSSCWAFASVATMESAQAISTGGAPPVLSEQQLVDCSQAGCSGSSSVDEGFKWVIGNSGITTAAAYPYTGIKGQCRTGMPVAVRLSGYKNLPTKNETAIMEAVARQPVAVGFDGSDPCFQHYIRGVYDAGCSMNGVYTGKSCQVTWGAQNHMLAIVGYGAKPDGTKYWIAKNSWTEFWGDKGFVYLLRDSPPNPNGVCGLAMGVAYPII